MGAGHGHALYVHEHSPVHRAAPEAKVLATFLFVVAVAITPRQAVWAFVAYFLIELALIRLSRVKPPFILARLVAVVPFVVFALLLPVISSGDDYRVVGLAISREGLWAMWNVLAKAGIGATASILLAATTETPDILKGLGRLRVPAVITGIASFMIRYLEVVVAELGRMRTAMTARGHDPRWLWQVRPIASSAGTLFVRSYERGERVYDAMLSRGFTGTMPQLSRTPTQLSSWLASLVAPALAIAISIIALVTT